MRKILSQNFGPMGHSWGTWGLYLRRPSLRACRFQIHLIWGPYEFPALVALQIHAKKPKLTAAWCEGSGSFSLHNRFRLYRVFNLEIW